MKKKNILLLATIGASILLCSTGSCSMISHANIQKNLYDDWSGYIRIEGEEETIWKGTISFGNSLINAENMDTHVIEEHEINYPCVLGALDAASGKGGFSYTVVYYPSWDSLFVTSINGDSMGEKTGWNYFVDYEAIMVGAEQYELTNEKNEVLWGYLYYENWETSAHALKISIDKTTVKKGEEFTITVKNEENNLVNNAIVKVGLLTYFTDNDGKVKTFLNDAGNYKVLAEKDPNTENTYVRSDALTLEVEKSRNKNFNLFSYLKNLKITFFNNIFEKLNF